MADRIVVTLVHGTFAPEAAWTKEGSKLRAAIVEAFAPRRVHFDRVVWRGWLGTGVNNGHRFRLAGGERLRRQIRDDPDPAAARFIVAHSHGGNVAMYAMRDPAVRARITGVVCLATPFIQCE